jgi:dihydroxy-acid dehydratase
MNTDPGAYAVGLISDEERFDVVRHSCPGAGACGGMYTYVSPGLTFPQILLILCCRANTMSSALEVLGMSLPYSSSTPAMYPGETEYTFATCNILSLCVREGTGMLQSRQVHETSPGA